MKLRLRIAKENIFISHLEFVRAITRALRRTGLPLLYSGGYHPRIKVSMGPALAVGIRSQFEYADITLGERIAPCGVIEKLNESLPEGIRVLDAEEISSSSSSITEKRHLISFRFTGLMEECLRNFKELEKSGIGFIKRERRGKEKLIKVMDYVKEIKIFEEHNMMEIAIESGPSGGLNPVMLLKEIGDIGREELAEVKIEKIGFREF